MQTLRIAAVAMTILSTGFHVAGADDAVWRSSKPLRVSAPGAANSTDGTSAQSVWDRIEYPLLVQRLQSEVSRTRADVEFWERRLKNYQRLRFTDAIQTSIKHAENSLQASRRTEADATRKLALVRRHRVALGEFRAQMLQRSCIRSQLDR